jgi:hypothetical protein
MTILVRLWRWFRWRCPACGGHLSSWGYMSGVDYCKRCEP